MARGSRSAKTRGMADSAHALTVKTPLERAHQHAMDWLGSLDHRGGAALVDADDVAAALGRELPEGPMPAEDVVDLLAAACEPGLVAMPSGRFYGFVIGGSEAGGAAGRRVG